MITWPPSSGGLPEGMGFTAVTYSLGRFFIATEDGRILISSNLRNWSFEVADTGPAFRRIIPGISSQSRFFAVGDDGRWWMSFLWANDIIAGFLPEGQQVYDAVALSAQMFPDRAASWLMVGDGIFRVDAQSEDWWYDSQLTVTVTPLLESATFNGQYGVDAPQLPFVSVFRRSGWTYVMDAEENVWGTPNVWGTLENVWDTPDENSEWYYIDSFPNYTGQPPSPDSILHTYLPGSRAYLLRREHDALSEQYLLRLEDPGSFDVVSDEVYGSGSAVPRDVVKFGDSEWMLARDYYGSRNVVYRKGFETLAWAPDVMELEPFGGDGVIAMTWIGAYIGMDGLPGWPEFVGVENLPDGWSVDFEHLDTFGVQREWTVTGQPTQFQQFLPLTVQPYYGPEVADQFARSPLWIVSWRQWDQSFYNSPLGAYPASDAVIKGSNGRFLALDVQNEGLWLSLDGASWIPQLLPVPFSGPQLFSTESGFFLSHFASHALYFSTDGVNWEEVIDNLPYISIIREIDGDVWVGTDSGKLFRLDSETGSAIFVAEGDGPVREIGKVGEDLVAVIGDQRVHVRHDSVITGSIGYVFTFDQSDLIVHGNGVWLTVRSSNGHIFRSTDLLFAPSTGISPATKIHFTGAVFLAATDDGRLLSSVDGIQWTERMSGVLLHDVAHNNDALVAVDYDGNLYRQSPQPAFAASVASMGLTVLPGDLNSAQFVIDPPPGGGFHFGTFVEGGDYTVGNLPQGFELAVAGLEGGGLGIQLIGSPGAIGLESVFIADIELIMLPTTFEGDAADLIQLNSSSISVSVFGALHHDQLFAGEYQGDGMRDFVALDGVLLWLDEENRLFRSSDSYDWYRLPVVSDSPINSIHTVGDEFWAVDLDGGYWRSNNGADWSGPHFLPDYSGLGISKAVMKDHVLAIVDELDILHVGVIDENSQQLLWQVIEAAGSSAVLALDTGPQGFALLEAGRLLTSMDGLDWSVLEFSQDQHPVAIENHGGAWWVLFNDGSLLVQSVVQVEQFTLYDAPDHLVAHDLLAMGNSLVMAVSEYSATLLISTDGMNWHPWEGLDPEPALIDQPRLRKVNGGPDSLGYKVAYLPSAGEFYIAGGGPPYPRILWSRSYLNVELQSSVDSISGHVSRLIVPDFSPGEIHYHGAGEGQSPGSNYYPYLGYPLPDHLDLMVDLQEIPQRRINLTLTSTAVSHPGMPRYADLGLQFPPAAFADAATSMPLEEEVLDPMDFFMAFTHKASQVVDDLVFGESPGGLFSRLLAFAREDGRNLLLGTQSNLVYLSEDGFNWGLVPQEIGAQSVAVGPPGILTAGNVNLYSRDGYLWEVVDHSVLMIVDLETGELEVSPSGLLPPIQFVSYSDGTYYAFGNGSLFSISGADLQASFGGNPGPPQPWRELLRFAVGTSELSQITSIHAMGGLSQGIILLLDSQQGQMLGILMDGQFELLTFNDAFGTIDQPASLVSNRFVKEAMGVFAIGGDDGLWVSSNGRQWSKVMDSCSALTDDEFFMYAISGGGVVRSRNGYDWVDSEIQIPEDVAAIAIFEDRIFASTEDRLWTSGSLYAYSRGETIISLHDQSYPAAIHLAGGAWNASGVSVNWFSDRLSDWEQQLWVWQQEANDLPWNLPEAQWPDEDSWFEGYIESAGGDDSYSRYNRHTLPSGVTLEARLPFQDLLELDVFFRNELSWVQDPEYGPVFLGLEIMELRDSLSINLSAHAVLHYEEGSIPGMDEISIGMLHIGEPPRTGRVFPESVQIEKMVWGAERFVLLDDSRGIFASDGQSWSPVLSRESAGDSQLSRLRWHHEASKFTVSSANGQLWVSSDGLSWAPVAFGGGPVEYWEGEFLYLAGNAVHRLDAQSGWYSTPLVITGGGLGFSEVGELMNFNSTTLVAWDSVERSLFSSDDGVAWQRRTGELAFDVFPDTDAPCFIEAEDGLYVFFRNAVLFSRNGLAWVQLGADSVNNLTDALRLPGIWVLTDGTNVFLSRDLQETIAIGGVGNDVFGLKSLSTNGDLLVAGGGGEGLWTAGVSIAGEVTLLTDINGSLPARRNGVTQYKFEADGPEGLYFTFTDSEDGMIASGPDPVLNITMGEGDSWRTIRVQAHTLWDADQFDVSFYPYDHHDWLGQMGLEGSPMDAIYQGYGRSLLEMYAFGIGDHFPYGQGTGLMPRLVTGVDGGLYFSFYRNGHATDVAFRVLHSTNLIDWQELLHIEAGRVFNPEADITVLPGTNTSEIRIPVVLGSPSPISSFFKLELAVEE